MINADRLLQTLHELRDFGRCGNGVVRRCLSDIDMQSRHWLQARLSAAGLNAAIDGVANVYATSPNPGPALLLGSHTDTQPTGGWLDGALGVVYGLEIAQALGEQPGTRRLAIDVASWADEEAHYLGLLGSRSFCGELTPDDIDAAANSEGHALRDALAACGLDERPCFRLDRSRYTGYLEAHIEQGPWLEVEGRRIGVVTSIVGMRDLTVRFRGQQNHAGTTPMHLRSDAAGALFEFARRVDVAFAEIRGEQTVWTIGRVRLEPNAPSIVPGFVEANLQFRDPDQARVEELQECAFGLVDAMNREQAVEVNLSVRDASARAVEMDALIQEALATAALKLAPDAWMRMPSGAAHDAQVLAGHLPTGMLFIPSIGGVSHDFAEDSREEDIVLGCEVLAEAAIMLLQARSSATDERS